MRNNLLFIITCLIMASCSDEKTNDEQSVSSKPVDTINYADFDFAKVIAFAPVDPLGGNQQLLIKEMDLSKFGDTISRTLNNSQVKDLTNILNGKLNKGSREDGADCHNPRHCVAFLDNKDSVINFVTICFECSTMKSSKPQRGSLDNFRQFFISIGLPVFEMPDQHKHYYDSLNKLKRKP